MTSGTSDKPVHCPECGAANEERRAKCWMCGADVSASVAESDFAGPGTAHVPPQFGLSSLFLIVTLACVCLGLASIAPGLIVPVLLVVVPALVRTLSVTQQSIRRGKQMTTTDKLAASFMSLGIVILIGVAGIIAFFAACLVGAGVVEAVPAGNQGRGRFEAEITMMIAFGGIGAVVAIMLMVWLFIKTWPSKR